MNEMIIMQKGDAIKAQLAQKRLRVKEVEIVENEERRKIWVRQTP